MAGEGDKIKVFLACITCASWYGMYAFLNSYIRTWRICFTKLDKLESTGKKIIFSCFMCCCFSCINCVFDCYGIVDIWTKPCEEFQEEHNPRKAYHKLVYLEKSSVEDTIVAKIDGMFK